MAGNNMFLAITPKKGQMKIDAVRFAVLNALGTEGTKAKHLLESTVENWEGEKPKFDYIQSTRGGEISLTVYPTGGWNDFGYRKWIWLNYGTSKRWAVMSRGFVRKTHPNSMGTNPGKDKVWLRGQKAMNAAGFKNPMDGIKPRKWLIIAARMRRPRFRTTIQDAIRKGVAKSGMGKP